MGTTFFLILLCLVTYNVDGNERKRVVRQDSATSIMQIQQFFSTIREDDGTINIHRLTEDFRDPLTVPNFNITDSGTLSSIDASFWNVRLSGIRSVEIRQIRLNLAHMFFKADVYFPSLKLDSEYQLESTMTFFTISGNGNMWMNVSDVYLDVSVFLKQIPTTGILEVESIDISVKVEDIKLHFDNLGGGMWASVTNALLNQLSNLIFEHIKNSLLRDLKDNLKIELDKHLSQLPTDIVQPRSTNLFDDIIVQSAESFKFVGLDPMLLPNHTQSFSQDLIFITANGSATIANGILYGLSTLHRTGDIILIYNNTGIGVEASLGFFNLTGSYFWNVKFMGIGLSGKSSVSIRSVSATLVLHQSMHSGSRPQVDKLRIDRIRQVWVDIEGLGTWDYIFEIIVNLITNSVKLTLANAIANGVKDTVQNQLDSLAVNFM